MSGDTDSSMAWIWLGGVEGRLGFGVFFQTLCALNFLDNQKLIVDIFLAL